MSNDTTQAALRNAGLPKTAEFHTALTGVKEFGSSSINGKYHEGFEEIRQKMWDAFQINPKGVQNTRIFRELGDPDTGFYYGGWKHSDDAKPKWINPTEYLGFLVLIADDLSEDAKTAIADISNVLAEASARNKSKIDSLRFEEVDLDR